MFPESVEYLMRAQIHIYDIIFWDDARKYQALYAANCFAARRLADKGCINVFSCIIWAGINYGGAYPDGNSKKSALSTEQNERDPRGL